MYLYVCIKKHTDLGMQACQIYMDIYMEECSIILSYHIYIYIYRERERESRQEYREEKTVSQVLHP